MSSTTTTAVDFSAIQSLATATEPVASVYVTLQPTEPTADAGEELGLRWRRLASDLTAQGADPATLSAIWRELAEQPASPARFAAFASQGSVLFRQSLPGAADRDLARYGAPAYVAPLLAFRQQHPSYVLVVVDRTGADLTAVPSGAVTGVSLAVVGPDDEIERNAPGGWAQARYQRRAEDSWKHNAAAVAREVTNALHRVGAQLLLVAGDVRAVQLVRDQLPAAIRHRVAVRQLPGGRSPDGSGAVRDAAIADAIADHASAQTTELMDRMDAERRPGGLGVEGGAATLLALSQRRVQTLFVVDQPDDERVAWFGPDTLCAEERTDPAQATSWEAAGRLVDVAVRAALLTDASVRILPQGQERALGERIGALCRFLPAEM